MSFSGVINDAAGKAVNGQLPVIFSLYAEQDGGTPLWSETQIVQADAEGHYTVFLGSTEPSGLPMDVFTSGAARWLAVQPDISGAVEQPRVMLVGVPYALKAADADTLGGKPASAFVTAGPNGSSATSSGTTSAFSEASSTSGSSTVTPAISGTGTTNYIPIWVSSTTLGNSILFQTGGDVGLGTTTPFAGLDVERSASVGIQGTSTSSSGVGVQGSSFVGVRGTSSSSTGTGVTGLVTATTGSAHGVNGLTSSPSGIGVFGEAMASSGSTIGVKGSSASGNSTGMGVVGSGTVGVLGQSTFQCETPSCPTEAGVRGTGEDALDSAGVMGGWSGSLSGEGQLNTGSAGVWADSGPSGDFLRALLATTDSGEAIEADSNTDSVPTVFITNFVESAPTARVFQTLGFPGGSAEGSCTIDVSGDLTCTGTKSAAVPVGNGRKVALYAVEAPENWFEDFGSGTLAGGTATITLDPTFIQTVNTHADYHVFLTPNQDCRGLYVSQKTPGSFEVRELGGGRSNAGFDYRIVARRKGYENVRLADVTSELQHQRSSRKPIH